MASLLKLPMEGSGGEYASLELDLDCSNGCTVMKSRWYMVRLVGGKLSCPILYWGLKGAHAAGENVGELCRFAHPLIRY